MLQHSSTQFSPNALQHSTMHMTPVHARRELAGPSGRSGNCRQAHSWQRTLTSQCHLAEGLHASKPPSC